MSIVKRRIDPSGWGDANRRRRFFACGQLPHDRNGLVVSAAKNTNERLNVQIVHLDLRPPFLCLWLRISQLFAYVEPWTELFPMYQAPWCLDANPTRNVYPFGKSLIKPNSGDRFKN